MGVPPPARRPPATATANSNGPPRNGQDLGADREPAESVRGQSRVLSVAYGGPLELGLMSVVKIQVSLVRLVRSTMLESLFACLFMDFCELTKPDSSSQSQIGTPLRVFIFIKERGCESISKDTETEKNQSKQSRENSQECERGDIPLEPD